jgi:hypothetical protein
VTIVLPIVLVAVIVGLFVPERYKVQAYWGMGAWITFIIAHYYWKN